MEPIIGAAVIIVLLWGMAALAREQDGEPAPPSLWHDLLLVLALVYLLRYFRRYQQNQD
jgi:hypothetical protein